MFMSSFILIGCLRPALKDSDKELKKEIEK
jgi:hypothetical protein